MHAGIIIEGPSNVTYLPGLTPLPIELTCNVTGGLGVLLWSINGTAFSIQNLPPGHRNNGLNLLIDTPINNTKYICVSATSGGEQVMSAPAFLSIGGKNTHVAMCHIYVQLIIIVNVS